MSFLMNAMKVMGLAASLVAITASSGLAAPNTGTQTSRCEQLRRSIAEACDELRNRQDCDGAYNGYVCETRPGELMAEIRNFNNSACMKYTNPLPIPGDECRPRGIPAPSPVMTLEPLGQVGVFDEGPMEGGGSYTLTSEALETQVVYEPIDVAEFDLVATGDVRFGGTSELMTLVVPVQNVGDATGRGGLDTTSLNVDGVVYRGGLARYMGDGSISRGDFPPGDFGFIQVYHATDFAGIEHCDILDVEIDFLRDAQQGGEGVFDNDRKDLVAREMGNPTPCASDPVPVAADDLLLYYPTAISE